MRQIFVVLTSLLTAVAFAEPHRIDRTVVAGDARAAALELLGPGAPLSEASVRQSLTGAHVRFRTLAVDGTPVAGEDVAVHLEGSGPTFLARLAQGGGRGQWGLVAGRRIDEAQALALAAAAVGGSARRAEAVALPAGPYLARPAWRVLCDVEQPARLVEVYVDAFDGGVEVGADLLWHVSGSGMVYRPNPVAIAGNAGLADNGDADSPLLTALREQVTLLGLDGSGYLRGEYVDVRNPSSRANQPSLVFDFTRSQVGFEEVNTYYHLDRVERQIQALGYSGAKAVLARPFAVLVNSLADDQSYFDPDAAQIRTGTGGVDDAEDADVIIHEYGHAVQDDIVPGFGRSDDARALGEGFADIQAYAMSEETGKVPAVARECLAAWDSTAYAPPTPCMRRVDGTKHYPEHLRSPREPHYDGELWSGTLHDLFVETGLGALDGYQLVLESTFLYDDRETMTEAAEALLLADQSLHGGQHVEAIRRVLLRHGLLATLSPASTLDGPWNVVPGTLESAHPILASDDKSRTFTQPGAQAMRVHFASISMETGSNAALCPSSFCDAIYLYDGDGLLYARLGGTASNVTSPAIPGDTVVVRWVSNSSRSSTGFVLDRIEAVTSAVPQPDAGPATMPPDAGGTPVTPGGDPSGGCSAGGRGGGGASPFALLAIAAAAAAARRRRRPRS